MIRFFLFTCALLSLSLPVLAETNADDRFFAAYLQIQQGDEAESRADIATAHAKFTGALTILTEIKTQFPVWHPDL
ncbi:MAG: hypothetical protein WCS70_14930, partial [Verrucomicrobiota bacterium]